MFLIKEMIVPFKIIIFPEYQSMGDRCRDIPGNT
jgi:hypothetical protein